ncbi:radical SAM protein [Candidatus Woesearchaeota archaeon]|nr:radical SAM protein [Candidatus Woesearchaeota archaeon]
MKVRIIRTAKELMDVFDGNYSKEERDTLDYILKISSVKLNERVIELSKKHESIAAQFLPSLQEASSMGLFHKIYKSRTHPVKGIDRGYLDRVTITPVMNCETFCRYCFLTQAGFGASMSDKEIEDAVDYIDSNPDIRYVLITGGDPLLNQAKLERIVSGLSTVNHIDSIRIGTRTLLFDPSKFNDRFFRMIKSAQNHGKRIEIGAHMNHPDEIDAETQEKLEEMHRHLVTVYTQTTLLRGINDDPETLLELYRKVYRAGGEVYLLFHCDPINGMDHLRTTVSKGLEIKSRLADMTSGRLVPKYKVAKCEIGVDSDVLEIGENHIWIETPYSIANLKKIIEGYSPLEPVEKVSKRGRLIIKYMGKW